MEVKRSKIKRVTPKGKTLDYVYDVSMKDKMFPWFYGNNMLVHNSAYFSVYEAFIDQYENQTATMTRDSAITMYDHISEKTNESFPSFMNERFNTGLENGAIIKAGRENLAEYGLFIKKKRYAMYLYDKDGYRQDVNGKVGKLKAMGIEIKRSDTPKEIQDALKQGLDIILTGGSAEEMLDYFKEFKEEYKNKEPWRMGRPSSANAVKYYSNLQQRYLDGIDKKKPRLPGAIAGAIAWNTMLDMHDEDHMTRITDGSKVITCRLIRNDYGYNSISYLTDQTQFPDWFKELPFDTEHMLQSILYRKIEKIYGVLDWNLNYIKSSKGFDEVFDKVDIDEMSVDDLF